MFTPESLQEAVSSLFKLNNYEVTGPLKIHGAEVDLRAQSLSDPFSKPIYIEVTIEYVDNDKYGKDSSKFLLIRELEKDSQMLIVSSNGFSLPVLERAKNSNVSMLSYDELFKKFEKFNRYVEATVLQGDVAKESAQLNQIYEEPTFYDSLGREQATSFLSKWRLQDQVENKWLIIVGEYGTGKTALTKVLNYRWMQDYKLNPSHPIPIRLELRDFVRQFDARSLLLYFLDKNNLQHITVDFFLSLIRTGRTILLLDGYDEMAQYMHIRERRACLQALAQLAAGGAKGILTSRPNYFSEAEELQVLDSLYSGLTNLSVLGGTTKEIVEEEKEIDALLGAQFLSRYERTLQDLTEQQTENLVNRVLGQDGKTTKIVLGILHKIFRGFDQGNARSLSGKPVIITYLLEIAEELGGVEQDLNSESLTEWQVYELIVDKLMVRDWKRAPQIMPDKRLEFLQYLAVTLSKKDYPIISEELFINLIYKEFQVELRHYSGNEKENEVLRIFADLRSSSTLTRLPEDKNAGWRFSHNSLREFLVCGYVLKKIDDDLQVITECKVSDAMKVFFASRTLQEKQLLLSSLRDRWPSRNSSVTPGKLFDFFWEAVQSIFHLEPDPVRSALVALMGENLGFDNTVIERMSFVLKDRKSNVSGANFSSSLLFDVDFSCALCIKCNFSGAVLDGVKFSGSDLTNADFSNSLLSEVDFSGANLVGSSFENVDQSISIRIDGNLFSGLSAVGYLVLQGAVADYILPIYVYQHHSVFAIAEKIAKKLLTSGSRQSLGLTQKGAANDDPVFARKFVAVLNKIGATETNSSRASLAKVTTKGRSILGDLIERRNIHEEIAILFREATGM